MFNLPAGYTREFAEAVEGAVCECGHPEGAHADEDYDHDGEGFVACPRPCTECGCKRYWEE